MRVADADGTNFKEGDVVTKAVLKKANEAADKTAAKTKKPKPARAKTLLFGIIKASLQSESFISATFFSAARTCSRT